MQLTPAQTAALTLELDKRDRQIRDDLRSLLMQSGNERYTDLVGAVHDPGDESVADMLSDLNNTLVARHVQELRELEAARKRLSDGTINDASTAVWRSATNVCSRIRPRSAASSVRHNSRKRISMPAHRVCRQFRNGAQ